MNRKPGTYALLAAVGTYDPELGLKELKNSRTDMDMIARAFEEGLKIDPDNIRKLGEDAQVTTMTFARSIAEFNSLLQEEDTFLMYFSGHGRDKELMFSDGGITVKSIVDYIEKLPAKRKIVILDCCHAGQAMPGAENPFLFEESVAAFAGTGIAVLASCASDSTARLNENGTCSLYTQIVCLALRSRRRLREGNLSLTDISDEIRYLMGQWNKTHPGKEQQPIYRESLIGTIYFPVEEYHPYVPQKVFFETEDYIVHHVKPLSTGTLKRLAAFVILKKGDDSILPDITRQIASQILYSDVYASKQSEMRFHGRPADVIWCYFGNEEADLIRSNHFAYTIWSGDEKLRDTYYRENRNAEIIGDVYIFWNPSYQLVKELQKSKTCEEDIASDYRKLSNLLIVHAEPFIQDLEEVENGTISFMAVKTANQGWIREVRSIFFKLTDVEVAPLQYHDWAETVLEMAGWVVDLALLLERTDKWETEGEKWLLKNCVNRYECTLRKLGEMERSNRTILI